jgi:hypothetical protein
MQMIVNLSDADLLARLKNFEHHSIERKTSGDKKRDWLKTVVAFANSAPNGFPCVLYLGVKDSGEIETPQVNLDALQKTFIQEMKNAYPPVPYLTKSIDEDGRQALAVIVLGSELRPHFAGLAYVRKGSVTFDASEQQFDELIAQRNSKAARILQWKGKNITVSVRTDNSEIPWSNSTTLVDCDQFYATIQQVAHEPPSSFPLSRIEINFDNLRKRLQLEISDPNRNPWEVVLERSARQVLNHMMTHGGHMLLSWLLMQGKIECQQQFMPEFSMDVQNEQMQIAVQNGLVRRVEEQSRVRATFYVINPEYLPVLKRVLPEFSSSSTSTNVSP